MANRCERGHGKSGQSGHGKGAAPATLLADAGAARRRVAELAGSHAWSAPGKSTCARPVRVARTVCPTAAHPGRKPRTPALVAWIMNRLQRCSPPPPPPPKLADARHLACPRLQTMGLHTTHSLTHSPPSHCSRHRRCLAATSAPGTPLAAERPAGQVMLRIRCRQRPSQDCHRMG